MSYLYVSKKKVSNPSRGGMLGWAALILCVALLIIFGRTLFSAFTSWWNKEADVLESTASAGYVFDNKEYLIKRLDELKNANAELSSKVLEFQAKAAAYDDLVGEVTVPLPVISVAATTSTTSSTTIEVVNTKIEIDGLLTKIIRKPPFTVFDTYVVDKGSSANVSIGDKVYARNMLVGTVQSVTDTNAVVSLYSSPGERLIASFGTSTLQFEAFGIGNGSIKSEVPRDAEINKGQEVSMGDREISLLGIVQAVDKDVNSTIKSVYISLPLNINETNWFVIKKQ